jgi:hypothetical protein
MDGRDFIAEARYYKHTTRGTRQSRPGNAAAGSEKKQNDIKGA